MKPIQHPKKTIEEIEKDITEISGLFGKTDHSKSRYAFKCVINMIFSNDEKLYALASKLPAYYHKYFFKLSSIVEETLSIPIIKINGLKTGRGEG